MTPTPLGGECLVFSQGAIYLDALGFLPHWYVRKLLGILYSFQFFQFALADMMLQTIWKLCLFEENGFSSLSSLRQNYKAIDFSVSKEAFLLCLSTFLGK